MNRGKVFISSTVIDFEDLRSALKYWLSEMGYEVFTSETCDFPKNSTGNTYQACFSAIEKCDFYILLIGSRYGSIYHDPDTDETISVTQAEYRTAYKLFTEGKIQKIIPFVRQKVWTAKFERSSLEKGLKTEDEIAEVKKISSPNADMPVEIFSFIDEVSRASEQQEAHSGKTTYPRGNWINVFNGFSDIVDTLRVELNMPQRLSSLVFAENLSEEIKQNLRKLVIKNSKGYFGMFYRVTPIRDKCIEQLKANEKTSVFLTAAECQTIAGTFVASVTLNDFVIKDCLQSGVFLDYDPSHNRYKQSPISKGLTQMRDAINILNSNSRDGFFSNAHTFFIGLSQNGRRNPDGEITVDYTKIAPILVEHDQMSNIVQLSMDILSRLYTGKKGKMPNLYPARLNDLFEVPESKKELFASYDEFYGSELSEHEIDEWVAELEGETYEAEI